MTSGERRGRRRLEPVGGFAHDLDIELVEHEGEAAPCGGFVIDYQHAHRSRG